MDCVFCDIIEGRGEKSVVYEDDLVVVFMDIRPVVTGDLMVVPKKHVAYMSELDEETGAHLFKIAMRVQKAIRSSGLKCEGINLFLADGEAAFQEIMHLHLHVFPRYEGDPFRLISDWYFRSRSELDETAGHITNAYERLYPSSAVSGTKTAG